jgi:hypothetical protein
MFKIGLDWWKLMRGPVASECTMMENENLRPPSLATTSSLQHTGNTGG